MLSKGRPILRHLHRLVLVLAGLLAACVPAYAEEQKTMIADPCAGPAGLLAVLDRPTVSDSACAVPSGHVVLETGFQHADVRGPGSGAADNYPQAEIRVGLPGRNEFVLLPPSYNRQKADAFSGSPPQEIAGSSAITLGLKHELGYTGKWLGAVEALFTLPSGGSAFGSKGLGAAVNGIAAYSLSEEIGLSLQLGISSQTNPALAGGGRYTFLSSNLVATWQPMERLQFYGELFGQSSTGPDEGAGYNADAGIQYLITPSWEVDMEEGVRLAGNLGGFTHYIGAGMGFRF
jgi:hypothetical protein